MIFDPLTAFLWWFVDQPLMACAPAAIYSYGPISSLVLYREGQFQVELFLVAPGAGFPSEHRHPRVDTYEVNVWGHIPLTVNGTRAQPIAVQRPDGHTLYITRVRETDWHGAEILPDGGAFLSVQYWLGMTTPTSVGLEWEGVPTSMFHANLLDIHDPSAPQETALL